MKLHPKYIIDSDSNKTSVILTLKEFNYLIEKIEDLEDVILYDEAKKRKQVFREAEEVFEEIEKNK